MVSRSQKIRLGIFLLLATTALIAFVVIVAGNRLMEKRDFYLIHYRDVSVNGLQVGSSVKYYGINIGQVDDIAVDPRDIRNVIVKIGVKSGTPIKSDMQATLFTVGITGLKQIELVGGTNEAQLLAPGANIAPGVSSFDQITGRAEVIAEKMEILLNHLIDLTNLGNRQMVERLIARSDSLVDETRWQVRTSLGSLTDLVQENRRPITHAVTSVDSFANALVGLTGEINATIGRARSIMAAREIDSVLERSARFTEHLAQINLQTTLDNLNAAINRSNETIGRIDMTVIKSRDDLIATIKTLRETINNLNEFSRRISDDPSFLIRSRK